MDYYTLIRECTDYIRSDPSRGITAGELADYCGYSLYHLSSVFRVCLGCSVGRFIQEEKLRLAAERLREGRKITDVALDAGFNTSAGFTKAFHRHFGCSPREYRNLAGDTPPRFSIPSGTVNPPEASLPPEFVRRKDLKVYGYVIPVEEGHAQSGKAAFWSNIDFGKLPPYPGDASDYAEIGIWLNPDDRSGRMDYFFGYVTNDASPAEGFESITLSGGNYAVFRLPYGANTFEKGELALRVEALWQYIWEEWLSSRPEDIFDDSRLCFEKYGIDMVEIYIPVSLY